MDSLKSQKFKNLPTQKFYEYFYPKVQAKTIDLSRFVKDFDIHHSVNNKMVFFNQLKEGLKGITIEQLEIAYKNYGISPNYFFGIPDIIIPVSE